MALRMWKGEDGTTGSPSDGDWATGANWSTGAAPDSSTDVAFAAGDYIVTLQSVAASYVDRMTIGAGVTLDIASELLQYGDTVNYGTVAITAAGYSFNGGTQTFVNYGELLLQSVGGQGSGDISSGIFYNEGLIGAGDTSGSGGSNYFDMASIFNDASGAIIAFTGSALAMRSYLQNDGLVEVGVDAKIDGTNPNVHGILVNLSSGGTLTGGEWSVLAGGTFDYDGAAVTTLAAGTTVTLSGAGSVFELNQENGHGPVVIDASLTSVAAGATLELLDGRGFAGAQQLQLGGTILLGGGALSAAGIVQASGALFEGDGTVGGGGTFAGKVLIDKGVDGSALAFTGDTTFSGTVSGKGALELSGGTDHLALAKLGAHALVLDGAYVYLDNDLSYGRHVTLASGVLDLGGHTLNLTGSVALNEATLFDDGNGLVKLGGMLAVDNGGFDELQSAVRNGGLLQVEHGILKLDDAVTGTGALRIDAGGTLVCAGAIAATQGVTFHGSGGELVLTSSGSFHATLTGFSGSDGVDLRDVSFAGTKLGYKADADGSGGTLRITDGSGSVAFHLEGMYHKADFTLSDDGYGDVLIGHAGASGGSAAAAFAPEPSGGGSLHQEFAMLAPIAAHEHLAIA